MKSLRLTLTALSLALFNTQSVSQDADTAPSIRFGRAGAGASYPSLPKLVWASLA